MYDDIQNRLKYLNFNVNFRKSEICQLLLWHQEYKSD